MCIIFTECYECDTEQRFVQVVEPERVKQLENELHHKLRGDHYKWYECCVCESDAVRVSKNTGQVLNSAFINTLVKL